MADACATGAYRCRATVRKPAHAALHAL